MKPYLALYVYLRGLSVRYIRKLTTIFEKDLSDDKYSVYANGRNANRTGKGCIKVL